MDAGQTARAATDASNAHHQAAMRGHYTATHRRLSGRGAQVMRMRDGKICQEHLYFDQVDVLTQLGLIPEPARA